MQNRKFIVGLIAIMIAGTNCHLLFNDIIYGRYNFSLLNVFTSILAVVALISGGYLVWSTLNEKKLDTRTSEEKDYEKRLEQFRFGNTLRWLEGKDIPGDIPVSRLEKYTDEYLRSKCEKNSTADKHQVYIKKTINLKDETFEEFKKRKTKEFFEDPDRRAGEDIFFIHHKS